MRSTLNMAKVNELNRLVNQLLNSNDLKSTGEVLRLSLLSAKATGYIRSNDEQNYKKLEAEIDLEIKRQMSNVRHQT